MAGKALNIGDDASSAALNENAPNVAGTRSDVKQGDAIEFDNYATIVFSFNTMPNLADTTGASCGGWSNRIRGNDLEEITAPHMEKESDNGMHQSSPS